jgi:hypothetical protein
MSKISFTIKEKIEFDSQVILLLSMYENQILPKSSVRNIFSVDKKDNLLWVVEPPITKFDIYSRIYFKDSKFFAITSSGQFYEIELETGCIIRSEMIK